MLLGYSAPTSQLAVITEAGFDYAEIPAYELLSYSTAAEFAAFKSKLARASLPIKVINCLFPAQMKITGREVDLLEIRRHLETVFSRAAELDAEIIVFGSGAARQTPADFSGSAAWRQLIVMLTLAATLAEENGLVIAIEPLRRAECNLLNRLDEALILTREINHPACRVLVDSYHLQQEGESFDSVPAAGEMLRHVHVDMPDLLVAATGESCPVVKFLQQLAQTNYRDSVTIENHSYKFNDEQSLLEQYRAAQELVRPLLQG